MDQDRLEIVIAATDEAGPVVQELAATIDRVREQFATLTTSLVSLNEALTRTTLGDERLSASLQGVATTATGASTATAQMAEAIGSSAEAAAAAVSGAAVEIEGAEDATARAAEKTGVAFETSSGKIAAALRGIGTHLAEASAALAGLGIASGVESSRFDEAMRNVSAMVEWTNGQFDQMRQSVVRLATELPFGPTELAKALFPIVSVGFDGADALSVLRAAAEGAQAGQADLLTTTQGLVTIMKSFNVPTQDAERVMNELVIAMDRGNMHIQDLAANLGRVASVAANFGVPLDQLLAAYAEMTNKGVDAAEAQTEIENAILHLSTPTQQQVKAVGAYNMELIANAMHTQGLVGAVEALRDVLQRLSGEQLKAGELTEKQKVLLRDILPDIRAMNGVVQLMGSNFAELSSEINANTGALAHAREEQEKALGEQWKQFLANLQAVAVELGDRVSPALSTLIGHLQNLLAAWDRLTPAQQEFIVKGGEVLAVVTGVAGSMALLGAAVEKTIAHINLLKDIMVGPLRAAVDTARGAWVLFNTVLEANPILAILGLVALLVASLVGLAQTNTRIGAEIRTAWADVRSMIVSVWSDIENIVGDAIRTIEDAVTGWANAIIRTVQNVISVIASIFHGSGGGGPAPAAPPIPTSVPGMAEGGIVTRPTLALLGEAGPEAVVPLSAGRAMLAGAGGYGGVSIVVNVSGNIAQSERELAERVAAAMQEQAKLQFGPGGWG